MINLFSANIETLCLHKVGNRSRNENVFLSEQPTKLNDEYQAILKEFFLKPFREKEENYYHFAHEVELDYHALHGAIKEMFVSNETKFHDLSKEIVSHLWYQSMHPHIKNGEVYVAKFTNVNINGTVTEAIGIFKSEIKADFLQVDEKGTMLEMNLNQGISLEKIDKGCLIFNIEEEAGYKILTIDNNRYDARYWLDHFLSIEPFHDDNFITKKYLTMFKDFTEEVVEPAEDKREAIMYKNKAIHHFASNDEFKEDDFVKAVISNPDIATEFKNWRIDKAEKYSLEDENLESFIISNEAVNDIRKKFKSTINLDTNISIKLDFINPESAEKFVEKGWDEEKQMYYYLCYFNKETK